MAKTVGDVISDARALLQDEDAQLYRYPTAALFGYLNTALIEAKKIRPDLFLDYIDLPTPSFSAGDEAQAFPVDEMAFAPCVFYVTGFAELRDDEFTVDNRAVTLMQQFHQKLLTVM